MRPTLFCWLQVLLDLRGGSRNFASDCRRTIAISCAIQAAVRDLLFAFQRFLDGHECVLDI